MHFLQIIFKSSPVVKLYAVFQSLDHLTCSELMLLGHDLQMACANFQGNRFRKNMRYKFNKNNCVLDYRLEQCIKEITYLFEE